MRRLPKSIFLSRRMALAGLIAAGAPRIAHAGSLLDSLTGKKTDQTDGQKKPAEKLTPGKQGLFSGGYSERFVPVRGMIARADYTDALLAFVPVTTAKVANPPIAGKPDHVATADAKAPAPAAALPPAHALTTDSFLANVEAGLLEFESGQLDLAIEHLKQAEVVRENGKGAGKVLGRGLGWIGSKVSGQGELAPYHAFDYESVLQLNYLALAHLLKGQPTCYNVARRCIDFQQAIKVKFEKEVADARQKLAKQQADDAKRAPPKDDTAKAADATQRKSFDDFTSEFNNYDSYARRVPNAYVNPLGDYLAGLIQEIASREELSLRDNSRIAYDNAASLCGRSPQMSAAALAMKRAHAPASERVVHVIVGEGFAPERKELFFVLAPFGTVLPIRVPIYTPVPSPVDRIEVFAGPARLAILDPIGDFEAIRMRSQQDRVPLITLDITTTVVMSYVEGKAAHKLGPVGDILYGAKELTSHADTRSWLSLPRRFHVARVVLPVNATGLTLSSFGKQGQRLATEHVAVPKGESQTVVYARAVDDHLTVQNARRLWIDGKLEIETHG